MNALKRFLIKKLDNRFNFLFHEVMTREMNRQISELAQENIRLRFKLKHHLGEKINVVFVCWRPAVWGSLKTVYEAMKADEAFDVKIITIPNKKQLPKLGLNHEIYESEGAEDFWNGDDVIAGYNYENGAWLDLRLLKADYICFQQPYNVCRTGAEKSSVVSKYAKLFYVAYAANTLGNGILEDCNPPDFVKDVSLYFTQNQMDFDLLHNYFKKLNNTFTKLYLTGFPRYDNLEQYKNMESGLWAYPRNDEKFRVVWTPRWSTDEGNCHFFDYKDCLTEYCKQHSDVDFIFRPHPQFFLNFIATGEMSEQDLERYKNIYHDLPNAKIDYTKEYLPTFYSSDCMITDISSVVTEYFLTGKPVIYCHKKDFFNDFSRKLAEGFYWVRNWSELQETLDMLKFGKDPLYEKRQKLIKEVFYIPKNGAGYEIKELIKKDFRGEL